MASHFVAGPRSHLRCGSSGCGSDLSVGKLRSLGFNSDPFLRSTVSRQRDVGLSRSSTSLALRQRHAHAICRAASGVPEASGVAAEPSSSPQDGEGGSDGGPSGEGTKKGGFRSSWTATDANDTRQEKTDFLYELGQADYNMNVDTGQNSSMVEHHFTGNFLGHKSDIADGSLRDWDFRKYNNIVGDYYIAPSFLDAITMHVAKNFMADRQAFDTQTRVPLILGIWGPKGQGKSFQTELCFKQLGLEPIIMSAGELEHEWAGTPGRLIRERYRRASELSRVRGKLSCLVINDIDAGLGHFANTQVTVNNQIVIGTLMAICDDPTRVSIAQGWMEDDIIRRIPIIVTGNDFTKMFAPLIRDGRMSKFYWKPSREDLRNIIFQMYKDDGLQKEDMDILLDAFPEQPLDFFGALRSAQYDNQIRQWIREDVVGKDLTDEDANMKELSRRLINRENLPTFEPAQLKVGDLLKEGNRLAREQDHVNEMKLSADYFKKLDSGAGGSLIGLQG